MEIQERIINNYENNLIIAIKELIKIGVLTTDKEILKYDIYQETFNIISFEEIKTILLNKCPNYWNIKGQVIDTLIINNLIHGHNLPQINLNQFENYKQYKKAYNNIMPDKDLKALLKELLNTNKKQHKKIKPELKKYTETQSQCLINNGVFLDPNLNYFYYNKDLDLFTELNAKGIFNILNQHFKFKGYEVTEEDIYLFMIREYKQFMPKTTTPSTYNKNKEYKEILKENEKDYNTITKIINQFE